MSSVASDASQENSKMVGGLFYHCDDTRCGLRFPVAPGDAFSGRCPRCGAPVQVVAKVKPPEISLANEGNDFSFAEMGGRSTIHLLLDNWRSLFNVGAAFRTADGAGVEHLYLCGITASPDQHPKLAKTALGAERAVGWSYHPDAMRLAASLRNDGAQLWVLERGPVARSIFDIKHIACEIPIVLAAGNEVLGVDPDLLALADQVIQLPMMGMKESLNVAVAMSIATYWLRALPTTSHEMHIPPTRA